MASIQDQIDALEEAMSAGVKQVSYDGRSVTYRDLDEMHRELGRLTRKLKGAAAPSRTTYASFSRD